ncbi:unnamed protein product [Linum tenue]|uniref:Uncharacterized protein n=1 Tax=Linum tenue TaxID=586396 RepID=A0AAV0JRY7_9ROSI|nr:unnamed protein product [Linum tenue]
MEMGWWGQGRTSGDSASRVSMVKREAQSPHLTTENRRFGLLFSNRLILPSSMVQKFVILGSRKLLDLECLSLKWAGQQNNKEGDSCFQIQVIFSGQRMIRRRRFKEESNEFLNGRKARASRASLRFAESLSRRDECFIGFFYFASEQKATVAAVGSRYLRR